ncbi:MAG: chemotaxis response regulator protein-glutamate methylesterase [Magnetospirillum sp. WYHS-4]
MAGKIRVLIVDDSALIRQMLTAMLSEDPELEVVGSASDPLIARERIKELNPDVITLDVEMPRMDGISFLRKIMKLRPMPVVMVSTLTQKGAEVTLEALEIGAVDFVGKPTIDMQQGMAGKKEEIISKVKAAARARVRVPADLNSPAQRPKVLAVPAGPGFRTTDRIVAIGASTGGVEALREVICALPADCPPILITQHMPVKFTESFAKRLDSMAALAVSEARDGERAVPGHVYIAPGGQHLELVRSGGTYGCKVYDGPLVSGHRPSVDVLFRSVAAQAGPNAVGAILTGMGRDGAEGLMAMREAGAMTLGQDESTALVYGMPRVAKEIGAVQVELPLSRIAEGILKHSSGG